MLIKDVKVLLNSEPHSDHAGGLAVIQYASGAKLWASEASADVIAAGGDDPDIVLPLRALFWIGILSYLSQFSALDIARHATLVELVKPAASCEPIGAWKRPRRKRGVREGRAKQVHCAAV